MVKSLCLKAEVSVSTIVCRRSTRIRCMRPTRTRTRKSLTILLFEGMIQAIQEETIRRIIAARVQNEELKRERVAKITGQSSGSDESLKKEPVRKAIKIGPNDPCPCGSGKKYKKCCYLKDKAAQ